MWDPICFTGDKYGAHVINYLRLTKPKRNTKRRKNKESSHL